MKRLSIELLNDSLIIEGKCADENIVKEIIKKFDGDIYIDHEFNSEDGDWFFITVEAYPKYLYSLLYELSVEFSLEVKQNEVLHEARKKPEIVKGCVTIDEAAKVFGEEKEKIWQYECMECGATYFGRFHSKYSHPEFCPVCDCDDELFIKSIGFVGRKK